MNAEPDANSPHTVLLRHELPGGSWHIDWMLDLDPDREAPLTTFRIAGRIDELEPGERLEAERIADHRRVYLSREGPLGDDRGHVVRVASGWMEAMQCVGDAWAFVIRWAGESDGTAPRRVRRQSIQLVPLANAKWIVVNRSTGGSEPPANVILSTRPDERLETPEGKDRP